MKPLGGTSPQTRPSLLQQLNTGDDAQWQGFIALWRPTVRFFSPPKAGLTPDEAEEVVRKTTHRGRARVAEFYL